MTKSNKQILKISELKQKNQIAELGGGEKRQEAQRKKGKLTARERIGMLLDPASFIESGKFIYSKDTETHNGDGVVCGLGKIWNRTVAVFAQDFTVAGGSLSRANANKIIALMDQAKSLMCPLIGLNDSGGARIQEGVESLGGYADIFLRNVELSGVVPQLSAILGPCAGGAVYSPALTDVVLMVANTSHMFITGPEVIKAVTKEDVSMEELGGALSVEEKGGVSHITCESESECLEKIRNIISFLPQNYLEKPSRLMTGDPITRDISSLNNLIPDQSNLPYDILELITTVVDLNSFIEIQENFAKNIVIGFARINGYSVGIVANQPNYLAGCLDIDSSVKAARFVRLCDSFNIPIITFVDVPGFLPGLKQEWGGIIRHGAKLLYAFAEATVPKITIICRKAYGGAYDVMSSKHLKGDVNLAYPSAEVAVMGPEAAIKIISRAEILAGASQDKLVEDYKNKFSNPWVAAGLGYIDSVIEPSSTRYVLGNTLELLKNKVAVVTNKKHGNIPL